MAMDLGFVELAEHPVGEAFDAETQHPKTGTPHRPQAFDRHGIDAVRADELQMCGNPPGALGRDNSLTQGQDPLVARIAEDIVLEDYGAHAGMSRDDALYHG